MTEKFVRWNCPNCETHHVLPIAPGAEPPALRCTYCEYVYDPLDDTNPRAEGWTEEKTDPIPPHWTRMHRRETPG